MACFCLWKRAVEKPVEIVEKFSFFNSYSVFFQSVQHRLALYECMYNHLLCLPDINYVAAGNRYLFPKHAVKS